MNYELNCTQHPALLHMRSADLALHNLNSLPAQSKYLIYTCPIEKYCTGTKFQGLYATGYGYQYRRCFLCFHNYFSHPTPVKTRYPYPFAFTLYRVYGYGGPLLYYKLYRVPGIPGTFVYTVTQSHTQYGIYV